MTDLHKFPIVGLLLLLNVSLHAFAKTTPLPSIFSSSNPISSIYNCPTDSLAVIVQSETICSRTLIEFQANLRTSNLTWDYGDGTINNGSTDGRATHAYSEPGDYTLKVTATYSDDCIEVQTIPISVLTSELDFTYQVVNNTVTFKANTTNFTSVNRYRWTYGDGAVASGLTPMTVYTYRRTGSFTVTLVGEGDCPASATTQIIMVGTPPSPENTPGACNDGIDNDGDGLIDCVDGDCECICTSGSFGCCDDFTAEFNIIHATPGQTDGSITIIPSGGSGNSINYQVNWGIMPMPTGFMATGLGAGTYPVDLIDTIYGCSLSFNLKVNDDNCRNIELSGIVDIMNDAVCEEENGTAKVIPSGGLAPHRFLWSNGATTAMTDGLSIGPNTVTITDARGCTDIQSFEMPSTNQPVVAGFTYELTGDSILFDNISTGAITKKQWTFNTPSLILNNKTVRPSPGNYEICLIVENDCGLSDKTCQTIGIAPACATEVLQINVLDEQTSYCLRQPIFLSTNAVAEKYTWYYENNNSFEAGSISKSAAPIYFEAGNSSIKLVVDYGNNCLDSTSILVDIIASDADFNYIVEDSIGQFIADTTDFITEYSWTFSGPYSTINDTGRVVDFIFPEPGEYTVSLMPIGACIPHITQKIISVNRVKTPENTARACSDGIDNDGDGLFDCEDSDCTCLTCPEEIIFTQQIQIDNFPITFPECTAIEGNVIIQSIDGDIENIEALSQLTAIGGDLLILENPTLKSLSGLENIVSIGGDVELDQNPLLNNLYDLKKLNTITGTLAIGEQVAMTALFDPSSSSGLSTVGGDLLIYGTTNLTDLSSFEKITSLGGSLEIANQASLRTLKGLNNLTAINGNVLLTNNAQLNNLSDLSQLTNMQGELVVQNNASLPTLTGLDNIVATSITKIAIQSSTMLSFCAVQSICDFLENDGKVIISGNATGCNNLEEIQAVCNPPAPDLFSTYPWLTTMVDTSSCTNEKITQYLANANQIFLYVETDDSAILYNENGQLWCTSSTNYDCQSYYKVVEILEIWNCTNAPIIDADMDGTPAADDPDDNDPCVPDNSVANCNTTVGEIPEFYDTYPWLINIVDPSNCTNEKITVYRSGGFVYLSIEVGTDFIVYNAQGTLYCANGTGLNCLDFYKVDEVLATWECGETTSPVVIDEDMDGTPAADDPDDNDPCIPDNSVANCNNGGGEIPSFYEEYPWLINIVNPVNCTDEKIRMYQSGSYIYFAIEIGTDFIVYNAQGTRYCSNGVGLNCLDFYKMDEVLATWECGSVTLPVLIDEDMDGTPASEDPDDGNPCVPDNTVSNCVIVPVIDVDMDGTVAADDPDDTNPCIPDNSVANCIGGGGEAPAFYEEYPWLINIVDPSNCTEEKITMYRSGGYIYFAIEIGTDFIVYNAQGTRYCSNGVGLNCLDFYKMDEVLTTWECGDNTPPTVIDEDMDGTPANEDPNDNDPCIPDNTASNCVINTPVDEDMDGTVATEDPDDNNPCVPDDTVANCDTGGTGTIPTFYEDYPWLNTILDPTDCTDEKITVYRSNGFVYLAVEVRSNLIIYNAQGTRYCANGIGLNCLDFYQIDEVLYTWECGDTAPPVVIDEDMDGTVASEDPDDTNPCIPDNTVANCNPEGKPSTTLFTDYGWLSNHIDPANCDGDVITVYKSKGYTYLLIETSNSSILYSATGVQYCVNSTGYDCTAYYTIDEIIDTWECSMSTPPITPTGDCSKNVGNIRVINCSDGTPFFFIELPNGTIYDPYFAEGLIFDYKDGQTVNFDFVDADFFSPCYFVQRTVIITCIEESTESCICPDINLPVCGADGLTYKNACEAACADVEVLGENECGSTIPNFFVNFPWMSNLIDPDNCTTEKITVYQTGFYQYIWIETPTSQKMYFENGDLYCTEVPEFDCIAAYTLDRIVYQWSCEGISTDNSFNQGRIASTDRNVVRPPSSQDFSIAPNPSRGQFFVTLKPSSSPQTIAVLSINGGVLQQVKQDPHDFEQRVALDMRGTLPGLYLVQVRGEEGSEVQRLVIE